jgi:hypothetical protein
MVDSYLEDITSEAEEEADDQAARGIEDEDENDGGAEEEENEQGDGIEGEEEQILVNLHGCWVKCHVKDVHIQALENEGLVAPQAESQWRTDHKPWYQLSWFCQQICHRGRYMAVCGRG